MKFHYISKQMFENTDKNKNLGSKIDLCQFKNRTLSTKKRDVLNLKKNINKINLHKKERSNQIK